MTSRKVNYLKVVGIITGALLNLGCIKWGLVGFLVLIWSARFSAV